MTMVRSYGATEAWLVLARLADMSLRRLAAVDLKLENPRMRSDKEFRTGAREFSIKVSIANEAATLEAFRPIATEEREALAERMCSQWGERFQSGRAPGASTKVIDLFNQGECPTCGAPLSIACRPVHAGERDAGDWAHPAREHNGAVEMRPHPDALKLAATQLRRGRGSLFRDAQLTEVQRRTIAILSTAVIAYARHDVRSQALGGPLAEEIDHELRDIVDYPSTTGRRGVWTFDEVPEYPTAPHDDIVDATAYVYRQMYLVDRATGADLDELATRVGVQRRTVARGPGGAGLVDLLETDESLRARARETMRPRPNANTSPPPIRQCTECGATHDSRLACDERTRVQYRLSRELAYRPGDDTILGPGPGTSKRCTCHTTADDHARSCAMATQPEPKKKRK